MLFVQFFTKLEEKMHAKESEMNQIQAKAQVCGIIAQLLEVKVHW